MPPNSINNWYQLEHKFHEQDRTRHYNGKSYSSRSGVEKDIARFRKRRTTLKSLQVTKS